MEPVCYTGVPLRPMVVRHTLLMCRSTEAIGGGTGKFGMQHRGREAMHDLGACREASRCKHACMPAMDDLGPRSCMHA